jgi:hypothetical protein
LRAVRCVLTLIICHVRVFSFLVVFLNDSLVCRSGVSATTAQTASTPTFLKAIVFNSVVFAIELAIFTLIRPYFKAVCKPPVYEPRTYVPRPECAVLTVKFRDIGMRDGNIVINIEISNSRGEKVIQGSAEVSQALSMSSLTNFPKNPAPFVVPQQFTIISATFDPGTRFAVSARVQNLVHAFYAIFECQDSFSNPIARYRPTARVLDVQRRVPIIFGLLTTPCSHLHSPAFVSSINTCFQPLLSFRAFFKHYPRLLVHSTHFRRTTLIPTVFGHFRPSTSILNSQYPFLIFTPRL